VHFVPPIEGSRAHASARRDFLRISLGDDLNFSKLLSCRCGFPFAGCIDDRMTRTLFISASQYPHVVASSDVSEESRLIRRPEKRHRRRCSPDNT